MDYYDGLPPEYKERAKVMCRDVRLILFGASRATGRPGWLADECHKELFSDDVWLTDITDEDALNRAFGREMSVVPYEDQKPIVVVNCAGKTGHPNIDGCVGHGVSGEKERQMEITRRVNIDGARTLAKVCYERGVQFIHLSSGCVFDATYKPGPEGGFTEKDIPDRSQGLFGEITPSLYADTKWYGDQAVQEVNPDATILRLRMPFSSHKSKRNLITKLARYRKVINYPNSMTSVNLLVDTVANMVLLKQLQNVDVSGVFNVAHKGVLTHEQVLSMYTGKVDRQHQYELVTLNELRDQGLIRDGRSNCELNVTKLERLVAQLDDKWKPFRKIGNIADKMSADMDVYALNLEREAEEKRAREEADKKTFGWL